MNLWVVFQALFDVLVLALFFYLFHQLRKRHLLKNEDNRQVQELTELKTSLDKLLTEAVEISTRLSSDIERKRSVVTELFDKLEREQRSLLGSVEELNDLALKSKRKPEKSHSLNSNDRYSDALRLARMGLSPEEISEKVQIPLGEIELVLSLRK